MILAKAVRQMEALKVRRLPVINKSKRMVDILSLGDVSHSAPGDLLSECVKSVSAHHHCHTCEATRPLCPRGAVTKPRCPRQIRGLKHVLVPPRP